jgi:pimeloyl-ACP methyl ester carboxylesterase
MKEGAMAHGVQTSRTVRSNDGTAIAFDRVGHGPPVIFVRGALNSAVREFPPFVELARLLEPRFTIYRFDRAGAVTAATSSRTPSSAKRRISTR